MPLLFHFSGLLFKDCTEFDSSLSRGPFKFPVGKGKVIKGWDSGKMFLSARLTAELDVLLVPSVWLVTL